jgi:peptidoglycan/LPS O-acetylase OafA/YrhL
MSIFSALGRNFSDAKHDLVNPPASNVPSLDVLRSIAILMVIAYHVGGEWVRITGQGNAFSNLPVVSGGWRGVDLFFVLSGYLIGRQLWRELRTTGSINYFRFSVIRRGLRIWPLYYFSILVWIVGTYSGQTDLGSFRRWWTDAAFLSNYVGDGVMPGAWSLCLEEQFYLLAPLLILGLLTITGTRDPRAFRPWLILLLVAEPVIRAIIVNAHGHSASMKEIFDTKLYTPIYVRADGLLVGLLIANFMDDNKKLSPQRSILILVASVVIATLGRKTFQVVFESTGNALFFGAITCLSLSLPRLGLPLFASRPFFVISRLSFGMYLSHLLFMTVLSRWFHGQLSTMSIPPVISNISFFSIILVTTFLYSLIIFYVIEWPFLKLRDRLMGQARSHPGSR